jgi:hypothetical protein
VPISASWEPDARIWKLTTAESFSREEIVELMEATDWQGVQRFLWDLRQLRSGPDDPDALRATAAWLDRSKEIWGGSRAAIVVARDLDFGIARMFQALTHDMGVEYQVFRDVQPARDWLRA